MVAQVARIELHGHWVGALAYDINSRDNSPVATFEYSPDWLDSGIEIAPLHMPLAPVKYRFPALPEPTYRGLPAVFADSLPDDFGNAVINAWLASRGQSPNAFTALDRLLYTGKRGMGAIEYSPVINRGLGKPQQLELESLINMAQQVIEKRSQLQGPVNSGATHQISDQQDEKEDGLTDLLQVGTSAGGARAKAVVALNADRSQIRSGQVDAPEGFKHYLIKFDGVSELHHSSELWGDPLGYGLMEYTYYLMAKELGIHMMPCELLSDGPRSHFLTERFDRIDNEKVHVLTLCGMDHADYKQPGGYSYEQLLTTARTLRLPRADAEQIFKRMVFNVVARNHDDHTKNTAFILNSNNQWRLAPAYDLAYSYKPGSAWVDQHQMSLNGKRDHFTRDDLMSISRLIGNFDKQAHGIINNTIDVVSQWSSYANRVGVFDGLKNTIQKNVRTSL